MKWFNSSYRELLYVRYLSRWPNMPFFPSLEHRGLKSAVLLHLNRCVCINLDWTWQTCPQECCILSKPLRLKDHTCDASGLLEQQHRYESTIRWSHTSTTFLIRVLERHAHIWENRIAYKSLHQSNSFQVHDPTLGCSQSLLCWVHILQMWFNCLTEYIKITLVH